MCKTNQSVAKNLFYKLFSLFMSSNFRDRPLLAVSGKSWKESPSSWQCLVVPGAKNLSGWLTGWKLHRVRISKGSEVLHWSETEVLGFEIETCQGSWLRNTQQQRSIKRAEWGDKSGWGSDGGGGTRSTSSSRYSCKQHIALNFFQCWSVHQQSAKLQL